MSGLTPLIDTLLHQVLGKRVDFLREMPLNGPVSASSSADAASPVNSDSRLETTSTYQSSYKNTSSQQPAVPASIIPPSASTRFSEAARLISEALLTNTGELPTINSNKPLLESAELKQPMSATVVAQKLQQSISRSGLFYESHVARWYKGEVSLKTILDEAQAKGLVQTSKNNGQSGNVTANSTALSSAASNTADASPDAPDLVVKTPSALLLDEKVSETLNNRDTSPSLLREGAAPSPHVLRQQLELMHTPALRWEGQIWPDVSVALELRVNRREENSHEEQSQEEQNSQQKEEWEVQCTVRSSNKSKLDIYARSDGSQLWLTLGSCSKAVLTLLERDRVKLSQRLRSCGFSRVELRGRLVPRQTEGT